MYNLANNLVITILDQNLKEDPKMFLIMSKWMFLAAMNRAYAIDNVSKKIDTIIASTNTPYPAM